MTALLTDNLPLLAGAPNGIKKLRELILELAVRGKLVPQDPNDEPASVLLNLLMKEAGSATGRGKGKKQALPGISESEQPFILPESWTLGRLGDVTEVLDSLRKPVTKQDRKPGPYPYYGASGVVDYVSAYIFDEPLVLVGEDGAKWGAGEKTAFSISGKTWVNNHAHVLRPKRSVILDDYLVISLVAQDLSQFITGMTVPKLNQARLTSIGISLPPLAEQHRIVAKVDELMALCDRLEARQADADSAHAQLVQALLGSLTQARDADDFAQSWQRLAEHFHTLFTTELSIDALKQTLLQLAVMGKLVPQDPSDEPASIYYQRQVELPKDCIRAGKQRIKEKALAGTKDLPCIPESWTYKSIDELYQSCHIVDYADGNHGSLYPRKDEFSDEGVVFLTAAQIAADGTIFWHECPRLSPTKAKQLTKGWSQLGDVFYTHNATVGRTAISREGPQNKYLLGTSVTFYRVNNDAISPSFLYWYFSSRSWSDQAQLVMRQTTRNQVSITKQALFFVALPPLAEQHRIVAKLDQLITLCDQLKTRLTQAHQLNEQLASTLVERALADDIQPVPVIADQEAARTLLAAEITHQLHGQRTFGQRKLQKVIYLAEHAARLAAVQGNYLRDAAGPHDRQLMNQVENELCNRQWYECIDRENFGHAYRPLSQAGQHRQAYNSAWSTAERATIEQVVNLMRDWDTDRCEMTVTLYAAWNDFIIEGRTVTDDAIVNEVLHRWNDAKLRFSKNDWLAVLKEMKKNSLLTPSGFGRRTIGGTPTLPGFEYSNTTS